MSLALSKGGGFGSAEDVIVIDQLGFGVGESSYVSNQ